MSSPYLVSIDLFFWNENFKKKSEDRQLFYSYFIILSIHINVIVLSSESICHIFFVLFMLFHVPEEHDAFICHDLCWRQIQLHENIQDFLETLHSYSWRILLKTFKISDKNVSHSSSYFCNLHYRSMVKNTNYN